MDIDIRVPSSIVVICNFVRSRYICMVAYLKKSLELVKVMVLVPTAKWYLEGVAFRTRTPGHHH